jgi:hypothetical protein
MSKLTLARTFWKYFSARRQKRIRELVICLTVVEIDRNPVPHIDSDVVADLVQGFV